MIPILLVIIPALTSFVINVILWCFMCHYSRQTIQSIHKSNKPPPKKCSPKSSPASHPALDDCQLVEHKCCEHIHSPSCRSSNCELVRNTRNKIKTSYYLTIIMLNIIDLPYYCFHMYFVSEAIFKWKNFKYEMSSPVTKKISGFFFVIFIVGHSINFLIYLMFHQEFRHNARSMLCQVSYNFNALLSFSPYKFNQKFHKSKISFKYYGNRVFGKV